MNKMMEENRNDKNKIHAPRCFLCNKKFILLMECSYCEKSFCIQHRYLETHGCIQNKQPIYIEPIVFKKLEKI